MGIFKKMMGYDDVKVVKSPNKNTLAKDRMAFVDSKNVESFQRLADKIIYGYPLLVNLDNMDREEANKLLSFLTGVVYAIDGKQFNIKDKIYLFASPESLEDKSIEDFVFTKRR